MEEKIKHLNMTEMIIVVIIIITCIIIIIIIAIIILFTDGEDEASQYD